MRKGSIFVLFSHDRANSAMGRNAGRVGMNYARLSQEQKREVILARRRQGDYTAIAKELGYTPSYVQAIATGKCEHKVVVNRLYNKVRGRKDRAEA